MNTEFFTREQVEAVVEWNGGFDEELFQLCRKDDYVEIFMVIQRRLMNKTIPL